MPTALARRVEAVRRFNRFYTRQIGLLQEGLLQSPFTLTEARVLYELAHQEEATATSVGEQLGLDAGYLSRLIQALERRGLIDRTRSEADRRQRLLTLTDAGQGAFAKLNAASRMEIEALLCAHSDAEQTRLEQAMHTIEAILGAKPEPGVPYILRPPENGDLGWIVHRHGVVYGREYGWDETFEAVCAGIVADFTRNLDPRRDRCWIAEREGEPVGSVFLEHHPERAGVARLRLLLVDPSARGLGIGRRLVRECTRFARKMGYEAITLWTMSVLTAARALYDEEGYRVVSEEPVRMFGKDLVSQQLELVL